jgi:hypothetical protein
MMGFANDLIFHSYIQTICEQKIMIQQNQGNEKEK